MKILHAIDKMDPKRGGVCQAVKTIIVGLTELGIENEIVCLDSPNEVFLSDENYTIHALGPSNNYWSFSKNLSPWLIENLGSYDAVIVHGLWQYPSYAFNRVKKKLGKTKLLNEKLPKLFVMPHGMLDPYFQTASGRKLKAIRNTIYWELVEKEAVNNADGILFTCETECILARIPFKPYRPKQELIVGLGVEVPPLYSETMKSAFFLQCPGLEDQNYFLFLSRIHEKKGVDILLRAYRELKLLEEKGFLFKNDLDNSLPMIPKLVIAGPGLESEYGKGIQQMVNNSNLLKENVFFPGMLSGNEKWGAFYGCEAFLLPSHQENFGIAIVEAMACKKAVLISNKVNIWKEIVNDQAGVIENDTIDGVSNLLISWLNFHSNIREQMGENALNCYNKNFSVKAASEKLLRNLASEKIIEATLF